jgi:hypothetical protein
VCVCVCDGERVKLCVGVSMIACVFVLVCAC